MSTKKLFLLDGHALVYRAHYAFIARPLVNSKGQTTSAISGFMRSVLDILQNQKPSHIGVSFDTHAPTFRHIEFEAYKANRDAQPEDIGFAIPWIKKILQAMQIPVITKDGWEADDLIGTLAKKAEKHDFEVFMVTPDKDYAQLVSEKIFLYKPSRLGNDVEIWGIPEVCARWNIQIPMQVIDILGLQGDAVDNIPGIPGIGEKTAMTLIEKFGSVENLIASSDQLKGKQQENVRAFAEQGLLSKKLATIDIDSPVDFNETDYEITPFDREQLIEIFNELEFRTLGESILRFDKNQGKTDENPAFLAEKGSTKPAPKKATATGAGTQGDLFGSSPTSDGMPDSSLFDGENGEQNVPQLVHYKRLADVAHDYILVDSEDKKASLFELLKSAKSYCFDTETTHVEATQADLVGMSFCVKTGEAFYVPVSADRENALAELAFFEPILKDKSKEMVGQNIKYDSMVLKNYGIEIENRLFDTMLAHYLWEPELRHGMDFLAKSYLQYEPISITELIGKKSKNVAQGNMRDVDVAVVAEYAAEDADVTMQLKHFLEPKLEENGMRKLFDEVEIPLLQVLADVETAGVRIDSDLLAAYSKELEQQIADLEKKIILEIGISFNLASPKQLGEVLFQKLKLPYKGPKLKSGQYSTDEEVLSALAPDFPIVSEILNLRQLSKLKSTYVDALPTMVNPRTGRIHSSFHQAVAATGRLSSNQPNLQNIPIRTAEGRKVREAFIPRDENHVLLSADYSQIELRLIAEIAPEEAMIDAFSKNLDIHRATAAKVYDVPLEEVTADQRRNAKTVNFSIIYGAGARNLSQQLGIKSAEAKTLIEQYFKTYAGLKKYMENTVEFARDKGYVETLLGRRRRLRDINSRNQLARTNTERVAINSPIQGTAADLIKVAMINIHRAMKEQNFESKMILQVHDELVFDVKKSELERLKPLIEREMREAIPNLKVPILVETGVGENWLEAH